MNNTTALHAWLAGVPADIRIAFRRLRRRPAFAVSAVLIFGLGTGFSTAIAGVYQALFLRPLPYAEEARLAAIISTFPGAWYNLKSGKKRGVFFTYFL